MRDYNDIIGNNFKLQVINFNVKDLIFEVSELFNYQAINKKISIQIDVSNEVDELCSDR